MISKTFRIARIITLAGFALSSAAWAATCSNASLAGTYGFLHAGVDSHGAPAVAVTQLTGVMVAVPLQSLSTLQSEMHFSFVVVDCGKELLAIETDADTAVSGTLQR